MASGRIQSVKVLTTYAFSLFATTLLPLVPLPAAAQQGEIQVAQASRIFTVNIPAKPLPQAIADLSALTGLQVLYTQEQPFSRNSQPVNGTFTAEQALGIMLQGSGLGYRFTAANAVTLTAQGSTTGGTTMLQPLTVTGEKIDRSLAETATSVAVFDAAALEQRPGLETTRDALARVPNVVTTGTNNFAPTVRGIDGTGPTNGGYAFVAGIRPRINLQIDGRPTSFNEIVYGNNSLWDVEQVEVLRGPQSTIQGRNAIAGAVVVKTKDPTWDWEGGVRLLGGSYDMRQGAAFVSGPVIEDQLAFRLAADRQTSETFLRGNQPYDGVSDPDEFESTALRGKLLIEPRRLDGFSTLLTFNYNKVLQPQSESVSWPEAGLQAAYPTQATMFEPRSLSGIADTSWILSDNLTFENTYSYTDLSVRRFAPPGQGYVEIDGYEMLEEPRLRFTGLDGRLKGLGGLHAFHASQDELFNFTSFGGDNYFKDLTTTYAAFGEATYTVVSDVDLTLGGRLERENRRRQLLQGGVTAVNLDETYEVFLPKAGAAWHVQDNWTVGATVARGYNGGGAGITFFAPITSYAFKEEYVWNYEAYTRLDLLGGRLNLTGNVFYADYKNMQLPYTPGGSNDTIVVNAPKAHTIGSEIGARYLAAPGLTVFGNIGLLKTEIDEFNGFAGNDLAKSPAFTADIGFNYAFGDGFDVGADARYSESYYSDIDNTPRAKVDPYWVANAQAGYSFQSVRVFGFVNNVFDNRDALQIYTDDSANILRPRTVGVGIDVTF